MTARIRIRRATAANWTADNPTLDHGEIGLAYDSSDECIGFKIGDGSTVWSSLPLMKPPTEGGEDVGVNVSWDEIALLSDDNAFTGDNTFNGTVVVEADDPSTENSLTVNGPLLVDESDTDADDGNVTVANGDLTVSDGDVTLPDYDTTLDTNVLRGASGAGGLFLSAAGPFLGYGEDAGCAQSSTPGTYGPVIAAQSRKIMVSGYDSADDTAGKEVTLEYANQPQAATDLTTLGDLVVPTKKLVVDHVAANAQSFGNIYFTANALASSDIATDFPATVLGKTIGLQKEAAWGDKYLMLVFHFRTLLGSNDETLKYKLLLEDGSGVDISPGGTSSGPGGENNAEWHANHGDGGGSEYFSATGVITTTAALESDGKLSITFWKTGHADCDLWIDHICWWASRSEIASDYWDDIDY